MFEKENKKGCHTYVIRALHDEKFDAIGGICCWEP